MSAHTAVCSPAPESAAQGTCDDRPVLTLCVATSTDKDTEAIVPASSEHGVSGTSMWPQCAEDTYENASSGMYTLHSRPGVVACDLQAKTSSLQGITVSLPDSSCLILHAGSLNFQEVIFEGVPLCLALSCSAIF